MSIKVPYFTHNIFSFICPQFKEKLPKICVFWLCQRVKKWIKECRISKFSSFHIFYLKHVLSSKIAKKVSFSRNNYEITHIRFRQRLGPVDFSYTIVVQGRLYVSKFSRDFRTLWQIFALGEE